MTDAAAATPPVANVIDAGDSKAAPGSVAAAGSHAGETDGTALDIMFYKVGRWMGGEGDSNTRPWVMILLSIVIFMGASAGWSVAVTEERPDKQWVPAGAESLKQGEYLKQQWPSDRRLTFFIATPKDPKGNLFEAKYVQALYGRHAAIMAATVDGDAIVKELDTDANIKAQPDRPWTKYAGNWSFDFRRGSKRRCYEFGPFCGQTSLLGVFRDDAKVIEKLDDKLALQAVNFWESQKQLCPISIASADSPCVNTQAWNKAAKPGDCQAYKTKTERENCRKSALAYCAKHCPVKCVKRPGMARCQPMAVNPATCADNGCLSLAVFESFGATNNGTGGAPDSAFAFEPFPISNVASSKKNSEGKYTSASALFGFYALQSDPVYIKKKGSESEPLAMAWEDKALCALGIDTKERGASTDRCPEDKLLKISAQAPRSLSDEFGSLILGDVARLSIAYVGMICYLMLMLSKYDPVHSKIAMSCTAFAIVMMSYGACIGTGSFLGQKNNNLNTNIPFLLLGLGVDDAFVLSAEFTRATRADPTLPISERLGLAMKHGGVSILITSATDAMAFFIGSTTVIPALHWFCIFAGLGVSFCFLFQITLYLPVLAIDARRAEKNRLDCCCCFKTSKQSAYDEPHGCCGLDVLNCTKSHNPDPGERIVRKFASWVVAAGRVPTLAGFGVLLLVSLYGNTQIYKDFKIEWFLPDDSYVKTFFSDNTQYFESGVPITVYTGDMDYFKQQSSMQDMHTYLATSPLIDPTEELDDWHHTFLTFAKDNANATQRAEWLGGGTTFTDKKTYYDTLFNSWYSDGTGARFRSAVQWKDTNCNDESTWAKCDPQQGIAGARISTMLKLSKTQQGYQRYETMTTMRKGCKQHVAGSFPYSFEFLYWEEMGIIEGELVRNLLVCGSVIVVMICMLIPSLPIAGCVILCIVLSIVDVIGLLYFWGVTINSISTIYILICVGLAVDYSAHIAHMFKEAEGTAAERTVDAMARIGPCVFNAVISTFLAVLIVAFSKSYIFRVFFKAIFLVTVVAGIHGLWLLPALLTTIGGDNLPEVRGQGRRHGDDRTEGGEEGPAPASTP